jgi:hypothetical protein
VATLLSDVQLSIALEHRHRHVDFVLARYPETANDVRRLISGRHAVALSERRRREHVRPGLTAQSLNTSLKSAFASHGGWTFETIVEEGVIFDHVSPDSRKEGFDISAFDASANLAQLWSLCFGQRPRRDGPALWRAAKDRLPVLTQEIEDMATSGRDFQLEKKAPTVMGDIQFGNWGLAYRDLMRLLDADAQVDVDLYVYITAAPSLRSYLSDGIVDFRIMTDALAQFPRLIRTPIWVIGLGLEELGSRAIG